MTQGTFDFIPVLNQIDFVDSVSEITNMNWKKLSGENKTLKILMTLNSWPNNKLKNEETISLVLNNLKSSWLHQLSLQHSLHKEDLIFANWDVIKFYYQIYCCVSAMARSVCNNLVEKTHYNKIWAFNNHILMNKGYSKLILSPYNVILKDGMLLQKPKDLTDWAYGQTCHVFRITRGLKYISGLPAYQKKVLSTIDYLMYMREWANYNGTHLTIYLYGSKPKAILKGSMKCISEDFQVMTENFIIRRIGFDNVAQAFNDFKNTAKDNLKLDMPDLDSRFQIYSNFFKKK